MEQSIEIDVFHPNKTNRHSNWLVDSRHEFSALETKMVACIINQLAPQITPQKDLFGDLYFKIPVSTFGKDYSFRTLKSAINKIVTRTVIGSNDAKQYAVAMVPIPWAEIKNGVLELKLQKEAVPYFVDIAKHNYTSYQFEIAMSLTSAYSQRLFVLLSRFKDTGKWHGVAISKFKFLLGIDKEKAYNGKQANGNLKLRVLEPAMKELAEKTDIEFDYKFKKDTGRKYTTIDFDIYTKKLRNHIDSIDVKERAVELLQQTEALPPSLQMVELNTALSQYHFSPEQRKMILDSQELQNIFYAAHSRIKGGVRVKKTPTRYVAWYLMNDNPDLGWK
jgi:plasmid replication initiation protein